MSTTRKILRIVLYIGAAALIFLLGRRSAQYHYNSDSGKIEPIKHYQVVQRDYIMLGDSHIRNGKWGSLLQRCDIGRAGYGGYTTNDLFIRMDAVLKRAPKKCFIEVGINDIMKGVSRQDYTAQLDKLVSTISERKIAVELFNIIYVGSAYPAADSINARVNLYNQSLDEVAGKHGLNVIDINSLLSEDGYLSPQFASPDGIHLSDTGYVVWAKELEKHLDME